MRAVTQRRYGGSEQLTVAEVDDPVARPDQVLVRVKAAGVDRGTWHLMTGRPWLMRPAFGLRGPRNPVLGLDFAGVVEAVGSEVTGVDVGEEVIGTADGSFAELAVASPTRLTRKPARLSFAEAAVLPVSGLTGLQAVRDVAKVRPGQQVLVIGASGGVGSYAVQVAAAYGAEVTGVASGAKADLVKALGATRVLDYTQTDIDADGRRYDVIIDTGGHRPLSLLRRCLTRRGTLVIVGSETSGRLLGGVDRQLRALLLSPVVPQRLTTFVSKEKAGDMAALVRLVEDGDVRPSLERTYALEEASKALDHLSAGHVRGKVALIP